MKFIKNIFKQGIIKPQVNCNLYAFFIFYIYILKYFIRIGLIIVEICIYILINYVSALLFILVISKSKIVVTI